MVDRPRVRKVKRQLEVGTIALGIAAVLLVLIASQSTGSEWFLWVLSALCLVAAVVLWALRARLAYQEGQADG